jgi:NAD+ diphosphatase
LLINIFIDLRRLGPLLKKKEATIMAYARGILHSHINYRYCSKCGHLTESREGGHMRLCLNPNCKNEIFPRTDPAVIMLVEYIYPNGEPPMCLLGSNAKWPKGFYSTLAGFVETGESLEEAVAREVEEEVGIKIGKVTYQTSQPWPFPSSLMLGFRAQAMTTEISVDKNEIKEARWFTAEEILNCGEWGDASAKYHLSRKDSISRFLIDSWVKENI